MSSIWYVLLTVIYFTILSDRTKGITCSDDGFLCDNAEECVDLRFFCDGEEDCSDGSDETYKSGAFDFEKDGIYCRRRNSFADWARISIARVCRLPTQLIPHKSKLCNEYLDSCSIFEFPCKNGYECVFSEYFCDGVDDCSDASDEPYWNRSLPRKENTTVCRCDHIEYMLTKSYICEVPDNFPQVKEMCICSDLGRNVDQFPCKNDYQYIPRNEFCNGFRDCRDGSDENQVIMDGNTNETACFEENRNCSIPQELAESLRCITRSPCSNSEFSCSNSSWCISMNMFCDKIPDCPSEDDELKADYFTGRKCEKKVEHYDAYAICTIPERYICDGISQCHGSTDECLCSYGSSKVYLDEKCFRCLFTTSHVISLSKVCDGTIHCPDASDECLCDADTRPSNCSDLINQSSNLTVPVEDCRGCDTIRFTITHVKCNHSNKLIRSRNICDGREDCPGATDEIGCQNRFYCTDEPIPHIPLEWKCNKIDDCKNGTDEHNCSHFHCNDGGDVRYLDQVQVCNGIQDCRDGSDECQDGCVKSAFSNESSMVENKGILLFVFLFGLAAVIGCFSICIATSKEFQNAKRDTKHSYRNRMNTKINRTLIMSLSTSDLLVGIYAFSICVKSFQLEGMYCLKDREWRASQTCTVLGAILIIGSEQSVLTMLLITFHRMHGILRTTALPEPKTIYTSLLITWIISILMGIIPSMPIAEDYFLDDVTFRDNPLLTTIKRDDVQHMTNWLSLMHNGTIPSASRGATEWSTLMSLVLDLNPNYTSIYKYGYYSSHAVCLPTFFPNPTKDTAWGYSLFLLLINFLSFFVIMISYLVIYRNATAETIATTTKNQSGKKNTRMQVKMTLIVATDLLCWMPICIMGFLQIGGVNIPNDAYLPAGLIIIPINSAVNPFLYSKLSDIVWDKISSTRGAIAKYFRRIRRRRGATEAGLSTGTTAPIDEAEL